MDICRLNMTTTYDKILETVAIQDAHQWIRLKIAVLVSVAPNFVDDHKKCDDLESYRAHPDRGCTEISVGVSILVTDRTYVELAVSEG